MIKKIRLMLSFQTFPMWLYDENDNIIDNDMPEEWSDDKELEKNLMDISDLFDSLFVNTSKNFEYKGFKNNKRKETFINSLNNVYQKIIEKNNNKYIIVNDFNIIDL